MRNFGVCTILVCDCPKCLPCLWYVYNLAGGVSLADRIILYYTLLYYTILYFTILYYTILYYTMHNYTKLYKSILYCTIL